MVDGDKLLSGTGLYTYGFENCAHASQDCQTRCIACMDSSSFERELKNLEHSCSISMAIGVATCFERGFLALFIYLCPIDLIS